jgi:23S rRNA pseudouridine1911/1915/1917 synthase
MNSLELTFGSEYEGVRVDVALTEVLTDEFEAFSSASRTQIQKLIAAGGVLVNGKLPRKNLQLSGGEAVSISLDEWAELTRDRAETRFAPEEFSFELPVLYEDEHILAVNKPAGVVVHPVQGMAEPTVVDYLRAKSVLLAETGEALKPGIVHRLDKGTSGVLLIAKDTQTHTRLQEMFEHRQICKHYLAITVGPELPELGRWEYKLARNPKHRELFMTATKGRYSITYYRMLAANTLCNFLLLRIITGRTHQIRVHLKENNHGIIGDEDYSKGVNVELAKFLASGADDTLHQAWTDALPGLASRKVFRDAIKACPGFFLHAYALSFLHPFSGAQVSFLAPLPEYFAAICTVFGWEAPFDASALLQIGGEDD